MGPRYLNINGVQFISAGDMSGDVTSNVIEMQDFKYYGIVLSATGTPTGTAVVQGSNDGTTWVNTTRSFGFSGSAADGIIENSTIPFGFDKLRVKYTASSGAGTLNGTIQAKA